MDQDAKKYLLIPYRPSDMFSWKLFRSESSRMPRSIDVMRNEHQYEAPELFVASTAGRDYSQPYLVNDVWAQRTAMGAYQPLVRPSAASREFEYSQPYAVNDMWALNTLPRVENLSSRSAMANTAQFSRTSRSIDYISDPITQDCPLPHTLTMPLPPVTRKSKLAPSSGSTGSHFKKPVFTIDSPDAILPTIRYLPSANHGKSESTNSTQAQSTNVANAVQIDTASQNKQKLK